jgi:hypothetical protein
MGYGKYRGRRNYRGKRNLKKSTIYQKNNAKAQKTPLTQGGGEWRARIWPCITSKIQPKRALAAELLAPLGRDLESGPEPARELEERILLAQGATAVNLHHDSPLALALGHLGVREGVQAAGVLEGGARGDGGGTVAGEREAERSSS